MSDNYCQCGRPKGSDESMCGRCWEKETAQSGETGSHQCPKCGRSKGADESMCEICWNRERSLGD